MVGKKMAQGGGEMRSRVSEVTRCHRKFNYKVISLHKGDFIYRKFTGAVNAFDKFGRATISVTEQTAE